MILQAVLAELRPLATSPILETAPVGPSRRRFANAAALVESPLPPPGMLAYLKSVERRYGRRSGQRWGARVIDLDILLWSGGLWRGRALTIPHARLVERRFALQPLAAIAPRWRLPRTGRTVAQALARLTRPRPLHRARSRSGP